MCTHTCTYACFHKCIYMYVYTHIYIYPFPNLKFPKIFTVDELLTGKWEIGMTERSKG